MVAAFDASSAMKTNAEGASSRTLVGFVVQEPGGTPRQVAPALHGDRHVAPADGRCLAGSRSALPACSGSWRTPRRWSWSPRPGPPAPRRSASATHPAPVGNSPTRPARCHHGRGCQRRPDPPRPSAVDRCCPPSPAGCRRSAAPRRHRRARRCGRRSTRSGSAGCRSPLSSCASKAASCSPVTIGCRRPAPPAGPAAVRHTRGRSRAPAPGSGRSPRPPGSRSTSVAPSPPTDSGSAIVVAPIAHNRSHRLLSKPDGLCGTNCFDRAVRLEELLVGRLQVHMVLGQAVVLPAQFVAVHRQCSSRSAKKNVCALL